MSVKLEKMVEEMKNLASQTEDTKSGLRFWARGCEYGKSGKDYLAIRTQLHWARSTVVALAVGVLLMVFHQGNMYTSTNSTFEFGLMAFILSRTLEVTAIVALFAAIVSLFLQDGGEMFSNMFIDSSDLEKSNEETSLKMMSFGSVGRRRVGRQ